MSQSDSTAPELVATSPWPEKCWCGNFKASEAKECVECARQRRICDESIAAAIERLRG